MFGLIFTAIMLVTGILINAFLSGSIFVTIVLFLIGLALIIKGGDIFVDAASWIAEKSGIPKFIIGATIVSIATTLPEMVASVTGTLQGALGLAVGNAIGSVTANTGMIMAISVMFMPAVIKRKDYAFKSLLLLGVTALLFITCLSGTINLFEAIIVILCFAAFIWENVVSTKASFLEDNKNEENSEETKVTKEKTESKEIVVNVLNFIFGAAGIYFGAQYLVSSGTEIATLLGVSDAIIGLTLVAIGTSLPELVTTITAIVKKQSALSVGNVIGANIIDMSLILPICAFVSGGTLVLDSMQTTWLDIPVCFAVIAIMVIPMLIKKKFSRWQGIAALAVYVAYMIVITVLIPAGVLTF